MLVPLYSFLFFLVFLFAWLAAALFLFSVGEIESVPGGTQYRTVEWSSTTRYLVIYLFFAFLWMVALILACNFFVMATSVCMWYFTSTADTRGKISIGRSIWWTIRYHLGSLAFGSFLLALIWAIRIAFEYINKQLEKAKKEGNPLNNFLTCFTYCCRCCLACCNRFIKYLNRNAYIQIALTSNNFCVSAINGFLLVLRNIVTFALTEGIGNLFVLLGIGLVSIGNTLVAYGIITAWVELESRLNSLIAPLLAVFAISYLMC